MCDAVGLARCSVAYKIHQVISHKMHCPHVVRLQVFENVADCLSALDLAPPSHHKDAVYSEPCGESRPITTVGALRISIDKASHILAIANLVRSGHLKNLHLNFFPRMRPESTYVSSAKRH
jgi:hypothetical protein